jgi:hypothetical protein
MRNMSSAGTRKYDAASSSVNTSADSPIPFGVAFDDAGRLRALAFELGMIRVSECACFLDHFNGSTQRD